MGLAAAAGRLMVHVLASVAAYEVEVGDFNGDGFPDLAVTNRDGVAVLLNAADW
jgi:hypothetical protein